MKDYLFPTFVMISALALAGGAALFTVLGFRELFEPTLKITFMAVAIEVGKIVAVSAIYQFREILNWLAKTVMLVMIIIAMVITSMGVYGYLSSAFTRDSLAINQNKAKIELIDTRKATVEARIAEIDADINRIGDNFITKRMELIQTYAPEKQALLEELNTINEQETNLKLDQLQKESEFGAIVLLAKSVDWLDESQSMLYFIGLIIFVFDPLAIVLTFVANVGYANAAKRKEDEEHDERVAAFNGTDPDELLNAIGDKLDEQKAATDESINKLADELADVRNAKPKSSKGDILDKMRTAS